MKLIVFGCEGTCKPAKCYMVGLLGCVKIEQKYHGESEGIDVYSYFIHFDNGEKDHVVNTIYITDKG